VIELLVSFAALGGFLCGVAATGYWFHWNARG
jgi:hypothetical protein